MELKLIVDNYISGISDKGYSDRSIERYQYILGVFSEFLSCNKLKSAALEDYFNEMTPESIIESLNYYVLEKGVTSEYTARFYISVIKEYFRYLKETLSIENEKLISSFGLGRQDTNSFVYKVNTYIKRMLDEKLLVEGSEILPLSDTDISYIAGFCDKHLNNEIKGSITRFNAYIKSLMIKMMIYIGVSLDVINQIRYSDINLEKGTIVVSKYTIHIPYKLRRQLEYYLTKMRTFKSNRTVLFTLYNGKTIQKTGDLGNFIKPPLLLCPEVESKSATTCLTKYAVIQLIDAGVDRDTILDLTGYGDTFYNSCKDYLNNIDMVIRSRQLDIRLKGIPSFDFL